MAISFYNAGDNAIYDSGQHFVPQEKYRLGYTPPAASEPVATVPGGITNSGGDNYYSGSTGELISGFNTATGNRQYNLNNPNKVNQFVNKGMEMFGMTPQRSVRDMLSPQDLNFGRNEFNEDTLSYDRTNMPGVLQPDVRKTSGIPLGIGAMIARALPDKYYDMNTVDQAYTQANMGYTGPTIFGDNSLGNKDPFGRNVRSAFGNYAEAQQKSKDKLEEHFGSKSLEEHGAEWDEEKGEFVGPNAVEINRLNKMNLSRYNFDKKGLDRYDKIKNIAQLKKQQREDYEKKTVQELDAADKTFAGPDGTGDYDEYSAAGGTPNYSIPDTNDPGGGGGGYSEARNTDGVQSAEDDMRDGGRAGYFFGGRVNYKVGGRTDAGPNRTTASKAGVGQINESGQKVSGGNFNNSNDGGGNNPPPTFYDNGIQVITDQSKLGFNYPTGLTKNLGIGQLTAILDARKSLEEEEPEGMVQYDSSIGPVDTRATFDTTTGPEFNASYTNNNFNANLNSKTGLGVNYSKDIGPGTFTAGGTYNPDGTYNAKAKYGISFGQGKKNGGRISFANGGLASIL
jgi:hypothetical protein